MEPFIGEIRMMGFGITPKGWLPCQGQTLPINQNQALFAVLGTFYGGNGTTTFNLPDLRGRAIVSQGQGPGLTAYAMGQPAGQEGVQLSTGQIPSHAHTMSGTLRASTAGQDADAKNPVGSYPSSPADSTTPFTKGGTTAALNATALSGQAGAAGGGGAHENRQPFMAMNYCIAITGIFPSRS